VLYLIVYCVFESCLWTYTNDDIGATKAQALYLTECAVETCNANVFVFFSFFFRV